MRTSSFVVMLIAKYTMLVFLKKKNYKMVLKYPCGWLDLLIFSQFLIETKLQKSIAHME